MKVSVVVAVFNGSAYITPLVESLDAQSMPADEYETILVDDGSTDDTLAVARELATTRPNMIVETIPPSGWPGRPRNIGTDLARGKYIFFSDADDVFGPRALERMYEMAEANDSDIVYGKVVRKGKATSYWRIWGTDQPSVDIGETAAVSRTVHKLFRTGFLRQHDIRFREGFCRLEDHEFMAKALPRAKTVSILASEPTYYWIHRNTGGHISDRAVDLDLYWGYYGIVFATWAEAAGPGEQLDSARVVMASQAFTRFSPSAYLRRPPESRQALFAAVHPVFKEHFPAELDARLPVLKRLRAQALREGDKGRFDRVQELRQEVSFRAATDEVELREGRLHVVVSARCKWAVPRPRSVVQSRNDRYLLRVPSELGASDEDRTLLESDRGIVELTVRHRRDGIEWPVRDQVSTTGDNLTVTTTAEIDLTTDAFGAPLTDGIWDLLARVQFLGESLIYRVALPGSAAADSLGPPVFVSAENRLSFTVGDPAPLMKSSRPRASRVAWEGRKLRVELADEAPEATLLVDRRGVQDLQFAVPVENGSALIDIRPIADDGLIDMWLRTSVGKTTRLAYVGEVVSRPGAEAYSTAYGFLSVKVVPRVSGPAVDDGSRLGGLKRGIRTRLGR